MGLRLSWVWGQDDLLAGRIANHVLSGAILPDEPMELPESPTPPWWSTTAGHMALRALVVSRMEDDPDRAERVESFLAVGRSASPLHPSIRYASASPALLDPNADVLPLAALGLSRDPLALRRTAKRLLDEGKTEHALRVYHDALEIASRADVARVALPPFLDDARIRRFALPLEESLTAIVGDMADHAGWSFAEWSPALPRNGIAPLAAYRALKDRNRFEADQALALVLDEPETPSTGVSLALLRASQAEALALRGDLKPAAERYEEAIAAMPDDLIRRTWAVNLAEIAGRLGDTRTMYAAWRDAQGPSPGDSINLQVSLAKARQRIGGATDSTDSDIMPATFSASEQP